VRRIVLWLAATIAGVALLFSYRTSLGGTTSVAPLPGAAAPGIVPEPSDSAAPPVTGRRGPSKASPRTMTVNGTVAQTQWGPVQVQLKITAGRITDVRVLQRPHGSGRDDEINGYALPQLRAEVLSAQNANIDTVSGATVTSGGYLESLQAALDAAHLG
jgi:uncharacterized protein with FMN-binding domain